MVDTVEYLDRLVSHGKVAVDPGKSDTVMSWPTPICVKEVQLFLGLANYYS